MVAVATSVDPRTRLRAQPMAETARRYEPIGAAHDLFLCTDPEVVLDGPAGTGKSLACLKRLDRNAVKYPGSRQLILRKTRTSLTQSALVTFEQRVIIPGGRVRFHTTLQAYLYPNGSVIVVGGMDKDSKVMSSEYDCIYVQEATELTEPEWEALTTRLRYGVMPFQQLIADCNPVQPTHWLNQRCIKGITTRLKSRHQDNPVLWDRSIGTWTRKGAEYISTLDRLTGVRKQRLKDGLWVGAEGAVYEFDRSTHVVTVSPFTNGRTHHRAVAGVDWGFTNPGTLLVGLLDSDDRLVIPHEVYQTRKTIDWWIETAKTMQRRYDIDVFACDPSEPAYIEQFRAAGLNAVPAQNAILPGIDAVQQRLRRAEDGTTRLVFVAGANPHPDTHLTEQKRPASTIDEFDAYVWDTRAGKKEKPVDDANHGLDALRYLVMEIDHRQGGDFSAITDDATLAALRSMGIA